VRKSNAALVVLACLITAWIAGEVAGIRALSNISIMAPVAALLVLGYFYLRFEEKRSDAKLIAIIGVMSALSVAGRVLFAAVPNIKPSTFIIVISGYVFGPVPGFMVGATTALVSNLFFGQGPWTVWQMLAWGLAGLVSGLFARGRLLDGRLRLSVYCAAWGFLFGWIMNLYFVLGFVRPISLKSFLAAYSASLAFDVLHAAGNFLFAFALGPTLIAMLRRYQSRFYFHKEPADLISVAAASRGKEGT
jgi:energy-coupling factor transport system substrate-specific component